MRSKSEIRISKQIGKRANGENVRKYGIRTPNPVVTPLPPDDDERRLTRHSGFGSRVLGRIRSRNGTPSHRLGLQGKRQRQDATERVPPRFASLFLQSFHRFSPFGFVSIFDIRIFRVSSSPVIAKGGRYGLLLQVRTWLT
jgi:hypothetical protein